jgi:hypothetical protein
MSQPIQGGSLPGGLVKLEWTRSSALEAHAARAATTSAARTGRSTNPRDRFTSCRGRRLRTGQRPTDQTTDKVQIEGFLPHDIQEHCAIGDNKNTCFENHPR